MSSKGHRAWIGDWGFEFEVGVGEVVAFCKEIMTRTRTSQSLLFIGTSRIS